MLIDCDTCAVRGDACANCVVNVLLPAEPAGLEWDETERRALAALADGGLLPRLRLASGLEGFAVERVAEVPAAPLALPWPQAPRRDRRVG